MSDDGKITMVVKDSDDDDDDDWVQPLPTGQHAIARAMRENKELKENEKKSKGTNYKKKGQALKANEKKSKGTSNYKKKSQVTKSTEKPVRRRITSKTSPVKVCPLLPNRISPKTQRPNKTHP